jgi:cyclic pyranopterin phosphate synthase
MLTHVDARNRPAMVDVGAKRVTRRTAHAVAVVRLPPRLSERLRRGEMDGKKGPVLDTAILAGIMGAKRTSSLIPLCHPLPLDDCGVEIELVKGGREAVIHCRVKTHARTGVEMEALTGAVVGALAFYDMIKAVAPGSVIGPVQLLEKTGGRKHFRARLTIGAPAHR